MNPATYRRWRPAGHALWLMVIILWYLPAVLSAAAGTKYIELILDASGSMNGRLPNGQLKISAAKKAVVALVAKLPTGAHLAFRAYGHQSPRLRKDCRDTRLLLSFTLAAQARGRVIALSNCLRARGCTPITYVLGLAARDFGPRQKGRRMIVLVSDGRETCAGDPCATALALAKAKTGLVIHTIGFGVDKATRGQLQCIARVSGGRYFPAASAGQLSIMLARAIATPGLKPKPKK